LNSNSSNTTKGGSNMNFRKFIKTYGMVTLLTNLLSIMATVHIGYLLRGFFDNIWLSFVIVGIVAMTCDILFITWLNDKLYEAYRRKVIDEATKESSPTEFDLDDEFNEIKDFMDPGILK
jgi:hypothetical protein